MGLRPTHRGESAFLRFIDSKRLPRDFRRSENGDISPIVILSGLDS